MFYVLATWSYEVKWGEEKDNCVPKTKQYGPFPTAHIARKMEYEIEEFINKSEPYGFTTKWVKTKILDCSEPLEEKPKKRKRYVYDIR